jgi:hypothetical protein
MGVRMVELHVGRFLVTTVAINCDHLPPIYRMPLYREMTYSPMTAEEAVDTTVDMKIAVFERTGNTRKYYLTEVQ